MDKDIQVVKRALIFLRGSVEAFALSHGDFNGQFIDIGMKGEQALEKVIEKLDALK